MTKNRFTQRQFDDALAAMIKKASDSGGTRFRIISRDLHRAVVGGSQPNRMPMACRAMWKLAAKLTHTVVHRTPSGESSSIELEYQGVPTTNELAPSSVRRKQQPTQRNSPGRPTSTSPVRAHSAALQTRLPDADLHLVACVKLKRNRRSQARDLYISPWFRKARTCVERTGRPWAILSAKHGLIWPDQWVDPYEQTLAKMSMSRRRHWANEVLTSLEPHLSCTRSISMLAGDTYRGLLQPKLIERGVRVHVPMDGLTQGRQLRWLNQCLVTTSRYENVRQFYDSITRLEHRLGGARQLSQCSGQLRWPTRGVYFLLEAGETRSDTGSGSRVVRIGTHGLKKGSKSTLWHRLAQHRGTSAGGGYHKTSVFRLIVGAALIARDELHCPSWGLPATTQSAAIEKTVEEAVSATVGRMSVLWLPIEDDPGPDSVRGYIERNAIALLSNSGKQVLDGPSSGWLGRHCDRQKVRESGLWNSNHVNAPYDPAFLDEFVRLVNLVSDA